MLSSGQIIAALRKPATDPKKLSIVPAPDINAIRKRGASSIDLRLGQWFRSFRQTQTPSVSLVGLDHDPNATEASRTKMHFVPFGDPFVLHRGRFVLGVTLEWLRLPSTLSGYVTGKSTLGRHGLVIETA